MSGRCCENCCYAYSSRRIGIQEIDCSKWLLLMHRLDSCDEWEAKEEDNVEETN